jgi:hypothetical protein
VNPRVGLEAKAKLRNVIRLGATLLAALAMQCSPAHGASDKEAYELQERCGKRAAERFKQEFGQEGPWKTDDGAAATGYRNHYSSKLNKCFILVTTTNLPTKGALKGQSSTLMQLYDVNENREYGNYFKRDSDPAPFECKVSGRICRSEKEWESLTLHGRLRLVVRGVSRAHLLAARTSRLIDRSGPSGYRRQT